MRKTLTKQKQYVLNEGDNPMKYLSELFTHAEEISGILPLDSHIIVERLLELSGEESIDSGTRCISILFQLDLIGDWEMLERQGDCSHPMYDPVEGTLVFEESYLLRYISQEDLDFLISTEQLIPHYSSQTLVEIILEVFKGILPDHTSNDIVHNWFQTEVRQNVKAMEPEEVEGIVELYYDLMGSISDTSEIEYGVKKETNYRIIRDRYLKTIGVI